MPTLEAPELYCDRVKRTMLALQRLIATKTCTLVDVGRFVRSEKHNLSARAAAALTHHLMHGSMPRMKTLERLEAFVEQQRLKMYEEADYTP